MYVLYRVRRERIRHLKRLAAGLVTIDPHLATLIICQILAEIDIAPTVDRARRPKYAARSEKAGECFILVVSDHTDRFVERDEDLAILERYDVRHHEPEQTLGEPEV